MAADNGTQRNTVFSAERVIAHKGVKLSVILVGQVLLAYNLERHVKITHAVLEPFYSGEMSAVPKIFVDFVLMYDMLKPFYQRRGHKLSLAAHFTPKNIADVNRFLCDTIHAFDTNSMQK